MALLDLCEKYFGCRSFYEVLSISKDASEKEGMRKLLLIVLKNSLGPRPIPYLLFFVQGPVSNACFSRFCIG